MLKILKASSAEQTNYFLRQVLWHLVNDFRVGVHRPTQPSTSTGEPYVPDLHSLLRSAPVFTIQCSLSNSEGNITYTHPTLTLLLLQIQGIFFIVFCKNTPLSGSLITVQMDFMLMHHTAPYQRGFHTKDAALHHHCCPGIICFIQPVCQQDRCITK